MKGASQANVKDDSIMETSMGFAFPMIMIYGFATCSGIYLMTPVAERELKTRPILNMSGISSFQYYLGLFFGDLVLFIPPISIFILFTVMFGIKPFCNNLDRFLTLSAGFGPALITLTYLVSQCFRSNNAAVRSIVPLYLIIGSLIPMVLVMYLYQTREENMKHFWFW